MLIDIGGLNKSGKTRTALKNVKMTNLMCAYFTLDKNIVASYVKELGIDGIQIYEMTHSVGVLDSIQYIIKEASQRHFDCVVIDEIFTLKEQQIYEEIGDLYNVVCSENSVVITVTQLVGE